jgi:hypothetical protein
MKRLFRHAGADFDDTCCFLFFDLDKCRATGIVGDVASVAQVAAQTP